MFQLCAELKQVQTKLVHVEQSFQSQASEGERQQQKIRELELDLARNSANRSTTTSLQEELQAERTRLIAADKKVCAGARNRCLVITLLSPPMHIITASVTSSDLEVVLKVRCVCIKKQQLPFSTRRKLGGYICERRSRSEACG